MDSVNWFDFSECTYTKSDIYMPYVARLAVVMFTETKVDLGNTACTNETIDLTLALAQVLVLELAS